MRITAITSLFIKKFQEGRITLASSFAKNAVFDKYPDDGNWFATQRPAINIYETASDTVTDAQGRGIYYWQAVQKSYFVNNDTVYQTSYAGSTMSISAGTGHVWFFELGAYLIILDPENNEGWTINSSTPTVIAQITDTDFPTSLARGGAVLNGRLYVPATDGKIYESDLENPTSWSALAFKTAEIEPDAGVYLGEHHQYLVALGTRTLEFFYDAQNPTGSSLNVRTDIDFKIGAVERDSFWEEADLLFWVGYTASGGIAVYSLQNFIPTKISNHSIDNFIGTSITRDNVQLAGSGFQVGGRIYYVITLYYISTNIVPLVSLIYELVSDRWYIWDLTKTGIEHFPLVGWTKANTTRLGEGILANGDLLTVVAQFLPTDTRGIIEVFEAGVFEDDVFTFSLGTETPIEMELVLGTRDFGNRKRKFQSELWAVATPTETNNHLTVYLSDEADDKWGLARQLNTDESNHRLRRLGKFRQRNYRLVYAGDEQYRLEGIETVERQGTS